MSVQIALLAPATRVASRKLGPTAGRRQRASPLEGAARLRDQQVGEHVRQVRHACHQAIVRIGVDRGRLRAEAREQTVQALIQHAGGAALGGRQVPGGAIEQVLARVLHAGGLRAGQRMPADEALVGAGIGDGALGRAHVGDHAVGPGAGQRESHGLSERPDGSGHEHDVGSRHGARELARLLVDRAELERLGEHALVGVIPAHLGVRAPRAARPMEPPIRPTPRTATFNVRIPA